MSLTSKQEKFAQSIADGLKNSDAYRAAGYSMKNPKTVAEAASRLAKDSKVLARIRELQGVLADKALWTREQSVAVLADVASAARPGEKVSAVKELNAMHGYLAPTKHEVDLKVVVNVHFD